MLMKNPRPTPVRTAIGTVVGLVLVVGLVGAAVLVGSRLFGTPFTTTEVDRSAPPVLLELRDLASFHAAQGQFEVTVDVEQDVKWVPSFLAGERVQFVSVGTVDAIVDFSTLTEASFRVDEETDSVTVILGPVQLADPVIDLETSHVMNRDRGLLDRLGGVFSDSPTSEAELYSLATDKIAAAAEATELAEHAEENVTSTVTAMLQAVGFDRVEVRFLTVSPRPATTSLDTASTVD
jgi:Protein of unknown function (DUF4230)